MPNQEPSPTQDFTGLVAVVTGAARGIGRAIASDLHARGARLVLVDRNAQGLAEAAQAISSLNRPATPIVADLASPAEIQALAETIAALVPNVDVLVNNAAIELDLPFDSVTAEIFDQVLAINLRAPLLVAQALVPLFPQADGPRTGGAIVNISSIHATHAFANAIPYACSKAALVALTRNLGLELAPRRIRVNAVCPGYIDTAMWDEWLLLAEDPETLARETAALHPLGRRGLPQDVAEAVAFLASPRAAWITGTHLVIDGGLTIRAHP